MKRLVAFILILCHMNSSMFLPQSPQEDVYDASGSQVDDITSVAEFIAVTLGYDHTADDENDDSGQNFHLAKIVDYTFEQSFQLITDTNVSETGIRFLPAPAESLVDSQVHDITTPPPEIA